MWSTQFTAKLSLIVKLTTPFFFFFFWHSLSTAYGFLLRMGVIFVMADPCSTVGKTVGFSDLLMSHSGKWNIPVPLLEH